MWRPVIACALSIVLTHLLYLPTAVANPSSREQRQLENLKTGIRRLGIGPDARIRIRLRDKTKISGYISEISDDSFVVVDSKTGTPNVVAYGQVAQAKGNNLSSNQKLAITLVVVGLVGVLIFLTVPKD